MLASVGLARPVRAQEPNSAGLVVVHGDGRVTTRCVAFSEAQISGYTLLQRSGLDLSTEPSGMGETVCRLDSEGCSFPQQSCFCQCAGESCTFWSYWQQAGGAWSFAALGASNSIVLPGSVDGWVWGPGGSNGGQAPPLLSHSAICATPVATATPSPTPSTTPSATPTALPTATASPTPTAPPTPTSPPPATPSPTWTAAPPTPTVAPPPLPVVPPAEAQSEPTADIAVAPWVSYFEADRRAIAVGESVTLRWRVHHADRIRIEAGGQAMEVALEGSVSLAPPQTVRYELVAESSGGAATVGILIEVALAPTPSGPTLPEAAPPQPTPHLTPTPVPSPVPSLGETMPTVSPLPTPAMPLKAIPEATAQAPGAVSTVALVAPENALVPASPRMEATVTQVNADDSAQWALGGELWVVGMAFLVGGLLLIFIVAAALWLAYWGD